MAGILNNKERMIDFLITDQGRRQMADGRMKIEFATVTDRHTFYQSTGSSDPDVAEDASNRVFFEATRLINDTIVPELHAGFSMDPFRVGDLEVSGKKIVSGTFLDPGGTTVSSNVISGSNMSSKFTEKFLPGLTKNFTNMQILSTKDPFADSSDFSLSAHTGTFVITDTNLDFPMGEHTFLDNLPNIYTSFRFSHLPNFKFMPPVNKSSTPLQEHGDPIGNYPMLSKEIAPPLEDLETLMNQMSNRQNFTFTFSEKSRDNNLIGQLFSLNTWSTDSPVEKLSIIDYGTLPRSNDIDEDVSDPTEMSVPKDDPHVFFIGRVSEDDRGSHVFVNLFTLVFE